MSRTRRFLLALLALPTLWLLLVALLWWRQEALLFHPQSLPADAVLATAPDVHERTVAVPGATLSVLELRQPRGVVFYLHGNAGSLKTWFVNLEPFRRAQLDLVMMDYRGFGKSTGRIRSEAELHSDVRAVWQAVAPRYEGKPAVFFGRSLGTGLATRLAAELQPALTVLVSPYQSLQRLAEEHYPWVPGAILRYPMRSDQWIADIRGPVLLLHGEQDTLIPIAHGRALQGLAAQARLVPIPGAGHNDLHQHPVYRQALDEALAAAAPAPRAELRQP